MSKIFIDTNILIYSLDNKSKVKKKKARAILERIVSDNLPVISTQVLQEFYVAATRKLGVDPLIAKSIVQSFDNFEVIQITQNLIKEAIDCSIINQLSFGDSLIIVTAEFSKCNEVYTEDLNAGQIIRGVRITNPFM